MIKMNKKIMIMSSFLVFMLIGISFATVVGSSTVTSKKKESPLYKARSRQAVGKDLKQLLIDANTRFFSNRVLFRQYRSSDHTLSLRNRLPLKTGYPTCQSGTVFACCITSVCNI